MSTTQKLYYDIRDDRQKWRSLNILIGARRIGKTFSLIDYLVNENDGLFIYMRNTERQIKICSLASGNPFRKWNKVTGRNVYIKYSDEISEIHEQIEGEEDKILGYAIALSTFVNMRGVSMPDVTAVFFDEFIEKRKLTFNQFDAFSEFYDTINDNREAEGEKALQIFMASNAQRLNSPILAGYNLIPAIEGMISSGQKNFSRGKIWVTLPEAAITELRKKMGLSEEIEGTAYYDETINNKFANDDFTGIGRQRIIEYVGIAKIDDIYIYKHKSNGTLYCCSIPCSNVNMYSSSVNRLLLMAGIFPILATAYAENRLFFSDFTIKSKLFEILK